MNQRLYDQHSVAWYSESLGCTSKTLNRATMAVAGQAAKAMLSERIALEAKRQLVHTQLSVQDIAFTLGFDEATNFVKFFKREAGITPALFRAGHRASPAGGRHKSGN